MADKAKKTRPKRLSKGQSTRIRRLKQAARKAGIGFQRQRLLVQADGSIPVLAAHPGGGISAQAIQSGPLAGLRQALARVTHAAVVGLQSGSLLQRLPGGSQAPRIQRSKGCTHGETKRRIGELPFDPLQSGVRRRVVRVHLYGFPVRIAGGSQVTALLGLAARAHQVRELVAHPRACQTLQGLRMVRLDQQREFETGLRRCAIVGLQGRLTGCERSREALFTVRVERFERLQRRPIVLGRGSEAPLRKLVITVDGLCSGAAPVRFAPAIRVGQFQPRAQTEGEKAAGHKYADPHPPLTQAEAEQQQS